VAILVAVIPLDMTLMGGITSISSSRLRKKACRDRSLTVAAR
jgi:hypothetical protein